MSRGCIVQRRKTIGGADENRRNVLTDPELLRTLAAEGILCWGGDVRDRDAYQGPYFSSLSTGWS